MSDPPLEALARGLGDRAARQIDPDQMADRVIAALRRPVRQRPPAWKRPALLAASLAALMVAGALANGRLAPWRAAAGDGGAYPHGLDGLNEVELEGVLDSLAWDAPVIHWGEPTLDGLDEVALQRLLEEMDQ